MIILPDYMGGESPQSAHTIQLQAPDGHLERNQRIKNLERTWSFFVEHYRIPLSKKRKISLTDTATRGGHAILGAAPLRTEMSHRA